MSRVIFKMSFKHPNYKTTSSRNVDHVNYIATRPGTDKTLTEKDLEQELNKEIKVTEELEDDDYLKYINERPNSHGLFGEDGHENLDQVKSEIYQVNSPVWRSIISLKEDDAKELGYLEKDKWQTMLRNKLPDIADHMGIKVTNLRWVGAVHMEKGHPHAHVMFWEKTPERTLGFVKPSILDTIRKELVDELFQEERSELMIEKNLMRELINDFAKNDLGKASQLVKEVKATGQELKTFMGELNQEGIQPRLYSDEELIIADKIEHLASMLPGHGRANLKFMPEDVKAEVRDIADYLLQQPEMLASLEKNLKAIEDLTRMYTGKEDAIQKARDNAYKDIRDRVSQLILKGAVESLRENVMYVDQELSQKAISFISNMNNSINLLPEHTKVLNEITTVFIKADYSDEDIHTVLDRFMLDNDISISTLDVSNLIKQCRINFNSDDDTKTLSLNKKMEHYLASLKLKDSFGISLSEKEAYEKLATIIKNDNDDLKNKVDRLVKSGYLKQVGEQFKLTNKGIDEILKVKDLDRAEREILKKLENIKENESIKFDELINDKNVFSVLTLKDPDEFKLSKYDTHIRLAFGSDNKVTLKELEGSIFEKYYDEEKNISDEHADKAEQEFDSIKSRIDKLMVNGYVSLDKETGVYSFTDEANGYFQYDEEKEKYSYTDEAMEKLGISKEMEFTGYDANVTFSYIDQAENGVLSAEQLEKQIYSEVANKRAIEYYERFSELLEPSHGKVIEKYLSIDDEGNIKSTKEGKSLGIGINQVNKFINEAGDLQIKMLSENGNDPEALKKLLDVEKQFNEYIKDGIYVKAPESSDVRFILNPVYKDINSFLYQIYKNDGSIPKEQLKDVLEKNISNREAEKQYNYITWRLDNLKDQGYLSGKDKDYSITDKGAEKRADILVPERNILRKSLAYLNRLGLISMGEDGQYTATDTYNKYMKSVSQAKENKTPRTSEIIPKDILKIIERTEDHVDLGKIERIDDKVARGKFINNTFDELKTDYVSIREYLGVKDITTDTIGKLSTTLLVSGVSVNDTKATLKSWYMRSLNRSSFEPGSKELLLKVDDIVDKTFKTVNDNNKWGKTTVISSNDWKEMFKSLGVNENDMPKWIYKSENWQSFKHNMGLTAINDLWKSVWRSLERQRMQSEAQAEYMKKQLNKQQAMNQSKEAMIEQMRKNKSNSLYKDDELEM